MKIRKTFRIPLTLLKKFEGDNLSGAVEESLEDFLASPPTWPGKKYRGRERVCITIDPTLLERAKALGEGCKPKKSVSYAIVAALDAFEKK